MNSQPPPIHLELSRLRALTIEYGEGWAYPHVCRVLRLIDDIGAGLAYDSEVVTYAAYLHDWGAFPRYRQSGVDHALRSMQIAEQEILPHTSLPAPSRQAVLEAIAIHDYRDARPATAVEALLLREADMLDMLGVVGMARAFAGGPNDLQICYERVLARRAGIAERLTLPRARVIADERLASMALALDRLRDESFGVL